jgi:peptidoglycan/LPS O-acetylase OafA/YrhL
MQLPELSNIHKPISHLSALDGFRGLLAMWVYLGHFANATGFRSYLLGMHALAVDLFMILSGFLMAYTWKSRGGPKNASSSISINNTLNFYIQRFFRIAPLYYVLLIVSYIFLPLLADMHDYVERVMRPPWAEGLENYEPHAGWDYSSFKWFISHISFSFGAIPGMEASTPLPDWSLSLEMQFYLIFPGLLALSRHIPIVFLAIFAAVLSMYSPGLLGQYLESGVFAHYGQPSLITYRLNAFMAGMVVALWLRTIKSEKPSPWATGYVCLVAIVCIFPLTRPVVLAYLLFVLIVLGKIPVLNKLLSLKPLRLLGDISYPIYLAHLLVVIPVTYFLVQNSGFVLLQPQYRFLFGLLLSAPFVFLFSWYLNRYVELPGIKLGSILASYLERFRPLKSQYTPTL